MQKHRLNIFWLTALFFLGCIIPLSGRSQLHGKYTVTIIIDNGEKIEPSLVKLLDSSGKTVLKKYCDTFGNCKFTGIDRASYRVINKRYRIDTILSVAKELLTPQTTQFPFIIDFDRCNFGAGTARDEIRHGKARLLLIGGLAPVYYRGQERFEKEFNIKYYDFGDSGVPAENCVKRYNQVVFTYLDERYGNTWRYAVRHDAIGITEYLKSHPVQK